MLQFLTLLAQTATASASLPGSGGAQDPVERIIYILFTIASLLLAIKRHLDAGAAKKAAQASDEQADTARQDADQRAAEARNRAAEAARQEKLANALILGLEAVKKQLPRDEWCKTRDSVRSASAAAGLEVELGKRVEKLTGERKAVDEDGRELDKGGGE